METVLLLPDSNSIVLRNKKIRERKEIEDIFSATQVDPMEEESLTQTLTLTLGLNPADDNASNNSIPFDYTRPKYENTNSVFAFAQPWKFNTEKRSISEAFSSPLDYSTHSNDKKINSSRRSSKSQARESSKEATKCSNSQPFSPDQSKYSELLYKAIKAVENSNTKSICLVPTFEPPAHSTLATIQNANRNQVIANKPECNISINKQRCLVPTFLPPKIIDPSIKYTDKEQEKSSSYFSKLFFREYKSNKLKNKNLYDANMLSALPDVTQDSDRSDRCNMKASPVDSFDNNLSISSKFTIASVEIFAMSRGECLPNPKFDPISAIFWHCSTHTNNSQSELVDKRNGILFVLNKEILNDLNPDHSIARSRFIQINSLSMPPDTEFVLFNNELEMFDAFVNLISLDIDPDFIVGYEVQKSSLGYITGII